MNNQVDSSLSIENKILLSTCLYTLGKHNEKLLILDKINNCKPTILIELAKFHKLHCLLYSILHTDIHKNLETSSLYIQLERFYKENTLRNIRILEVFRWLSGILVENKIHYLPLKGVFLANQIYANASLRPMVDIDVLIRSEDYERTLQQLSHYGKISHFLNHKGLEELKKDQKILLKGIPVELHHSFTSIYSKVPIDTSEIWKHTIKQQNAAHETFMPEPEMLLLLLMVHQYEHAETGYPKLIWFLDCALFYQSEIHQLDQVKFQTIVDQTQTHEAVNYCSAFIQKYFKIDLPWYKKDPILEKKVSEVFFTKLPNTNLKSIFYYIYKIKNIPGYKNKVNYLFGRFFPGKAFLEIHFKTKNRFLLLYYLLLHLMRSIIKTIQIVIKQIFFTK